MLQQTKDKTARQKYNQQLRKWMQQSGCITHPAIQIPAYFDGVQGIGTKEYLPHKTVIIAIPSKLVITVPKCYTDPQLKSLFKSSDQLFDYDTDQDAQFNILCVFLMYHKMHIQKSPWSVYLKTIAQPETGVSWPDKDLAGLNKSVIQQILHVRRQCMKVQQKLCTFLAKSKQFKHLAYKQIVNLFRICYPTVLTRCFGYYFSTACMIPIADLMNHGCETIDHQLIHLNFERDLQFDQTYNYKKHKLNCQLMGLPKPSRQSIPFRLQYLLKNNLIQNDIKQLSQIRRLGIDNKIYNYLSQKLKLPENKIQQLDFCQQNDEQDNDTDDEQEYGHTKQLEYIKTAEKQQMVQFQKYYLQVEKLKDVEARIKENYGGVDQEEDTNSSVNKNQIDKQKQMKNSNEVPNNQQQQIKSEKKTQQLQNKVEQKLQDKNIQNKNPQQSQAKSQQKNKKQQQKKQIFPNQNMIPIQYKQSSSESSCSEQQQWCLDETCYFAMSTHGPVNAGAQLFNSYGSRTNKFLLVWYGFTYRNNLYDSVTVRLQANFPAVKPRAKDIVLDTYVGGQGLCFKKNQQQYVRPQQVSRQFRLKRSRLPLQFLMFLRLFLTYYYDRPDNYKILTTVPSSFQFQIFLLNYFKQIVQCLYDRYPLIIIEELKQLMNKQTDQARKSRINFKIIYLQQQRLILDQNMKGVQAAILVIKRLQQSKVFKKQIYSDLQISTIRKIREYLIQIKASFEYIMYSQPNKVQNSKKNQEVPLKQK